MRDWIRYNEIMSVWRKVGIGNTILSRLLLCFLVSTLLPAILITALLCIRFDRNYRDTAHTMIAVSQNLITNYLESYQKEIETITSAPYYHSYFSSSKTFSPSDPDYQSKLSEFQSEMQGLINLVSFNHSDIRDLVIYSDGQLLFFPIIYNEYSYFQNKLQPEEQLWYLHAMEANGKTVYTPAQTLNTDTEGILDDSSFYVSRKIRNLRLKDQDNIIVLNLRSKTFDEGLKNIDLLYNAFAVITNEKQELIYSGHPLTESAFNQIIAGGDFRYDGSLWNCYQDSNQNEILNVSVVYSLDEISRHTRSLIGNAIIIYLACCFIALVLFYSFNRWIVHSTADLQNTFTKLETGDLTARCPEVPVEEFNRIGRSINNVLDFLNEKIRSEYLLTIRQKTLQLAALRSQIQPHFLINTLYCFIALNQIGEKDKLNDGFYSLARLLRYVLQKDHLTTIGAEVDFLEDYLKLQQLRFGERLTFEIECPEDLRTIQIPRLLLQPLVENAIIHGIEPCEHPCFCRIQVLEKENRIRILIEDSGVGFDATAMEKKLSSISDDLDPNASVGLPYVKSSLLLRYPDAELHVSRKNTTRVEIDIPREEILNESADR